MKKKKNIEQSLNHLNIPFEKEDGLYYLWNDGERCFPYNEKEVWRLINSYKYDNSPMKKNVKKFSNKKERTRLRENLNRERFEMAEIRDNKENIWHWD